MSLSGLLSVIIPSDPGYQAPQAPSPAATMFREITEKRPHSRRTKRSHIIIAQEHLDAIVAMLARGNMTAGAITKEYGALAATSVLVALHNLEDAGRVVRVGSELRTGRPIVWGLAR